LARSRLAGLSLVQKLVKMSSQKLVDYTSRRRIEDLDSSLVMAENDSVLTDSQSREAFKVALKGFGIAASIC
jgi:hypothetical protein